MHDPRSKQGQSYPFSTVLAHIFLGLLAKISTFAELQRCSELHFRKLKKLLADRLYAYPICFTKHTVFDILKKHKVKNRLFSAMPSVAPYEPMPDSVKSTHRMIRLGTRGSVLARWQAHWTAKQLQKLGIDSEIVIIQTSGDRIQDESIINIGNQGVFTKEIQRSLLDHSIDVAVHSLKDLPTENVAGLSLAAVPLRESYRDAFVSNMAETMDDLPVGSRIGTGSLRRKNQILHHFGNRFRVEDIRGNVETRLRKLQRREYDALILSEAGLLRLGFADVICSVLDYPFFLPAVGQGALGLEIRTDDQHTAELLNPINDANIFAAVCAERSMLRELCGGCSAPMGALGNVKNSMLTLHGRVLSFDGKQMFEEIESINIAESPELLGISVAQKIIQQRTMSSHCEDTAEPQS